MLADDLDVQQTMETSLSVTMFLSFLIKNIQFLQAGGSGVSPLQELSYKNDIGKNIKMQKGTGRKYRLAEFPFQKTIDKYRPTKYN